MSAGRVIIPQRPRSHKNPLSTSETIPSRSVSEVALTAQVRADAAAMVTICCKDDAAEMLAILGLDSGLVNS